MIPQIFQFQDSKIRVVDRNGEPWFVAKDVAEVLGYEKPRNAISAHCKGALKQGLPSTSGEQEYTIIPERDLYRLIMRSKLPSAEKFEEWVVGEVLPTIRKTGTYGDPIQALNDPVTMRGLLLTYSEKLIELQPKAEALDRIASADGSLCLRDAAKTLQINPSKLNARLQADGWIYRRPGKGAYTAYQSKIQQGLLVHKVTLIQMDEGDKITEQVRVTPKGLAALSTIFGRVS